VTLEFVSSRSHLLLRTRLSYPTSSAFCDVIVTTQTHVAIRAVKIAAVQPSVSFLLDESWMSWAVLVEQRSHLLFDVVVAVGFHLPLLRRLGDVYLCAAVYAGSSFKSVVCISGLFLHIVFHSV